VTFADGVLCLAESVWVDAREFEQLCAAASAAPSVLQPAQIEQALALYVGDLLPDERYAEWTLVVLIPLPFFANLHQLSCSLCSPASGSSISCSVHAISSRIAFLLLINEGAVRASPQSQHHFFVVKRAG
jgi:hypothetical protein